MAAACCVLLFKGHLARATLQGPPCVILLALIHKLLLPPLIFPSRYEFPHMYTSPELNAATTKLIYNARKNGKILGLFLFGTDRVKEFMDKVRLSVRCWR